MIHIRPAVVDDVPWLLQELRAFNAFYGTKRSLFPEDADTAHGLVLNFVEQPDAYPFFVADDGRGPVGFIAGALHPRFFNPATTVLSELFWWVAEGHRGTSAGARLLAHFDAFGRAHADWIILTLETHSPIHDRALTKRGYTPHERSFLLEVETR